MGTIEDGSKKSSGRDYGRRRSLQNSKTNNKGLKYEEDNKYGSKEYVSPYKRYHESQERKKSKIPKIGEKQVKQNNPPKFQNIENVKNLECNHSGLNIYKKNSEFSIYRV